MWPRNRKVINLALQGGGAHGAFTWGVLDRLLEDERLAIEGISGTSSGAMNAAAVAYGLTVDGRSGARRMLAELWGRIGVNIPTHAPAMNPHTIDRTLALEGTLALTRIFSPYQLNPLNLDPLREIVTSLFDFERLRNDCRVKLFIAATQVRTGKLRVFETRELSADVLLASACLPSLHQAVIIDGEAYWDGGYAGNPALFPLFYKCDASDIIITLVHPLSSPELPTSASDIYYRTTKLSFGTTFLREMRTIAQAKSQVDRHVLSLSRLERRLRRLNVHLIEPDQRLSELDGTSMLDNRGDFLLWLREHGRTQADVWLNQNFDCLGKRSSIDIAGLFC
jgi:NTE family protein